jgi:hypothetical protein
MRRVVLPGAIALICALGVAGVASLLLSLPTARTTVGMTDMRRLHRVRPELFELVDQAVQRRMPEPGQGAGKY